MALTHRFAAVLISISLLTAVRANARQAADAAGVPIPQIVSFSGTLWDFDGKPASGVVGITFVLYREEQGGRPLWLETQNVTLDDAGRFSVKLGASTPEGLPAELFAAKEARWLAIEPQGLPAPARVMLLSVPYALKAGDAETFGGLPPSAFVLAAAPRRNDSSASQSPLSSVSPQTMSGAGTANYIPRWTPNGTTLGNSVLFQSGTGSAAKVGLNTTAPAATLDVNGPVVARGALQLPSKAAATGSKGSTSQPLSLQASAFNSSTQKAIAPKFEWQAEPEGNNTANPGGSLNLLYTTAVTPVETGLSIGGNGQINFAPGQTFPGTGKGTVTGVTAGAGLTGGGTTGSVTLGVDATKVPLLSAANTFTAPITFVSGQTFPGTGTITGVTAGAGLTGGGATGGVTLGIDSTKVPLLSAANTFTGKITFAPGQTFPGTGTLTGITAGAGLTGGGTTGSPTLGIDTTKVPLLNAANTFTAPITFASGQSFPGTGTITGVTAGNGLSGGGSSGAITLNLNTTYSDGRYAQTGANNTFSGVQIINNSVGIGVSPSYPLHVMGTIRSENGLSLSSTAPLSVDAPFIPGGRFLVLTNGNVGINKTNPSSTLDVGGNINASGSLTGGSLNVSGAGAINGGITTSAGITAGAGVSAGGLLNAKAGLQINGDTTMNAAPHMVLTGYVPGPLSADTYTLPIFTIPSKDILITRAVAFGVSTCPSDGALTFEIDAVPPGSVVLSSLYDLNFATAYPAIADSGALSISVAAGSELFGYISAPDCGSFGTAPSQLTVSIEYVMQ